MNCWLWSGAQTSWMILVCPNCFQAGFEARECFPGLIGAYRLGGWTSLLVSRSSNNYANAVCYLRCVLASQEPKYGKVTPFVPVVPTFRAVEGVSVVGSLYGICRLAGTISRGLHVSVLIWCVCQPASFLLELSSEGTHLRFC